MNTYEVEMSSKPGMWEFYDGTVTVQARNDIEAEQIAIRKLATGAFKDRGYCAWRVHGVKRVN